MWAQVKSSVRLRSRCLFLTIWAWKERKQALLFSPSSPSRSRRTSRKKNDRRIVLQITWRHYRWSNLSMQISFSRVYRFSSVRSKHVSDLMWPIDGAEREREEKPREHVRAQRERANGNEQNVRFNRFEFFSRLRKNWFETRQEKRSEQRFIWQRK